MIVDSLIKNLKLGKFNEFFNIFKLRSVIELYKNIKKKFGVIKIV